MKMGILGFPKAGKTTLFNTLTAAHEETGKFAQSTRTNLGVARVRDGRLAQLRDLYQPRRYVPATVEYVDIPGLTRGDGSESVDLVSLRSVDALVHVVRAFEDPEIVHPEGRVDPVRDVIGMDLELILADHELVTRRLDRLREAAKRGLSDEEKREKKLLVEVVLKALEEEKSLRGVGFEPDDERRLRGFQLLSAKPMLVALNVDESRAGASPESLGVDAGPGTRVVVTSAPIEAEISQLDEDEQQAFLSELGLSEPSADRLIRASYELLGLVSFFTVGEDEVRAWTIPRGRRAKAAAGAIHSDIERGFIRAEVVPWQDLITLKSLAACRDRGVLRLEGKEYEVQDGDVVHFRFNV